MKLVELLENSNISTLIKIGLSNIIVADNYTHEIDSFHEEYSDLFHEIFLKYRWFVEYAGKKYPIFNVRFNPEELRSNHRKEVIFDGDLIGAVNLDFKFDEAFLNTKISIIVNMGSKDIRLTKGFDKNPSKLNIFHNINILTNEDE